MPQLKSLSNREQQVAKLLLQGKSNKMIASSLGISERTVEFHLKNIYAKMEVSSRIELVLKLGNATGKAELRQSTVAKRGKRAENGDRLNPRGNRAVSFRDAVSNIGTELKMKNLLNTKHVPLGVITALLTGFSWLAVFQHYGHMSLDEIKPWILPLAVIFMLIGLSVGFFGKRNDNSLGKVFFSTLFGTGTGAFAMIPIVGFVVYPIAKLAERIGIIDPSTMPRDVATTLATISFLASWLITGTAIGIALLFVVITRPRQTIVQPPAPEHHG